MSLGITGCSKSSEENVEYIPVSTQQDSITLGNMQVTGIGQWTGFNTTSDEVQLYPYFDVDRKVTLKVLNVSDNNFWYDFVQAQGYTMESVKFYPTGAMTLTTGTCTFGYCPITDSKALFAYTYDLSGSYVNLAMSHVTVT